MDVLRYSEFFQHFSGDIYITQLDDFEDLKTISRRTRSNGI